MDIQKLFEDVRSQAQALAWEGSFEEYLNMVLKDPAPTRLAHARIHDMIIHSGVSKGPMGVPSYGLFAKELYGLDRALDRIVAYFRAATQAAEVRKRILLLMGPPASGKSTIVNLLKAGLEQYTRTREGAVYAIKGCPMQEEPLHLIPPDRREEFARTYGIQIEGELCPRCRYLLSREYGGDIARVRVRRVVLSASSGVGVGSFVATGPYASDISRLVGSVDESLLSGDRMEESGRAFRLEGEFEAANRGIMEFIEIFKSDPRFLTVLLGVSQERQIKLGNFGVVYADEAIVAHSNLAEYEAFSKDKESKALLDRMIVVKVPYNLSLSQEERIYRKLLGPGQAQGPHISPLTLRAAASLAVLSRLESPKRPGGFAPRLSNVEKVKLLDGQVVYPYTIHDVERLLEENPREGLFGISPRYVTNRLADLVTRGDTCILPHQALESIIQGIDELAGLTPEEEATLPSLLQDALALYEEAVLAEAKRALVPDFQSRADSLFNTYVKGLEAYAEGGSRMAAAEEPTMSRLEGALGLKDSDKPLFRDQVRRYLTTLGDLGRPLHYADVPSLKKAIEEFLFPSNRYMDAIVNASQGQIRALEQRQALRQRLLEAYGYCYRCADDLLDAAGRILRGRRAMTFGRIKRRWL